MTEPTNTPYPQQRTQEQHEAVRRRALPVAICGVILGFTGLILLLIKHVGVGHPPNLVAANLSFCALMMGVGIIFYIRSGGGTSGTAWAIRACGLAILLGLIGPMIFTKQSVDWRKAIDMRELQNTSDIAGAAKIFAEQHEGKFPESLTILFEANRLPGETFLSPYGGEGTQFMSQTQPAPATSQAAAHSDYTYCGSDLKLPIPPEAAADIIVVYKTDPITRQHFSAAFVDGTSKFLMLDEAQKTLERCNAARKTIGLPPLQQPDSIARALRAETQPG